MIANRNAVSTCLALLLAGCAAAAPGYEPLSKSNMKRMEAEAKAPPPSGGFVPGAGYVLTDEEKRYDCRKLSSRIQIGILRLRDAHLRPPPSAVSEVGKQVSTIISPQLKYKGLPTASEERMRLDAYNKALAEKRCRTFDIDGQIKAGSKAAVPTPVAPPAKKK